MRRWHYKALAFIFWSSEIKYQRQSVTPKWYGIFRAVFMNMYEGNNITFSSINNDRTCFDRFSRSRWRLLITLFERREVKKRMTSNKKPLKRTTISTWRGKTRECYLGLYILAVLYTYTPYHLIFFFLFRYENEKLNRLL